MRNLSLTMLSRLPWVVAVTLITVLGFNSEAAAATILEYELTNDLTGYQPGGRHFADNYAAIHGNFGGGSLDHAAATVSPAQVRLTIDEQSRTLERFQLSYVATLTGVEVDYQNRTVAQGQNGAFNEIALDIDVDLTSRPTSITFDEESLRTGAISAAVFDSLPVVGTLEARGPNGARLVTTIGAMLSGQHGCSICIGDYSTYNGPAFSGVSPYFSTWLPIYGSYFDPLTGGIQSVAASLDINAYLRFGGGERPSNEVPEPGTMVLLAASLFGAGYRSRAKRTKV